MPFLLSVSFKPSEIEDQDLDQEEKSEEPHPSLSPIEMKSQSGFKGVIILDAEEEEDIDQAEVIEEKVTIPVELVLKNPNTNGLSQMTFNQHLRVPDEFKDLNGLLTAQFLSSILKIEIIEYDRQEDEVPLKYTVIIKSWQSEYLEL